MNEPANQEEAIFDAALKLPVEQRADYLQKACASDAALKARVEALLKACGDAGGFMEEPPAAARKTMVLSLSPDEKPGDKIGRYKLLQLIGEGGCGMVYMAEQEEPVRRRVALKVIKLGMDTKSVIARFEAERQALAMMDHPNIAKVLEAGATETGRPFFVMELVRGIKITDYCDQNKLSTAARLDLFVQVCNAIQHAHQKGIIHRDIKPSNILVTLHDGAPVPKVIDFGIAKATQGRLTDQTLFTAFEQFIGTPAYMSPEQAEMSGLDIDTRSDIYALGVLLYELLTGRTPFDAKELLQSGLDELRRTIREKEPARPSTRLSTMLDADLTTVAQRRQSDAPRLIHLLSGDLDWIVMKSLEKDRTRRYETANGMAMDIQRYLANEPIIARPPSTIYRFQKLVRRNKTMFATAGVGMAALVIGLIAVLYLFVQDRSALKRAVAAELVEKQFLDKAKADAVVGQQVADAELALMGGQYDKSEQLLSGIPPHATLVPFYNVFGTYHACKGEWLEALTNWQRVIEYAPQDQVGYQFLPSLLLQLNDVEGYKKCRAQILQQFGNTSDPRIAERMVKASLIIPPTADEMAVIAKMADVAAGGDTNDEHWGLNLYAVGLAQYRLGHFTNAVVLMQRAISMDVGWNCRTEAYLVLAMAQFELNQPGASRAALAEAADAIKNKLPQAGDLDESYWNDWINAHVLMREAMALIPAASSLETPAWQTALTRAGLKFTSEQRDDGTWDLTLDGQPVTNLMILRDALLSRLSLARTPVSDLSPLRGMPLIKLRLAGTKVTDLSPLEGMPLKVLQLSGTPVTDIGPLHDMPLVDLKMTGCGGITNVEPIAGITTLQNLVLPPGAKNFDFLRSETNILRISFRYDEVNEGPAQTAAEFWAQQDGKTAQP
ncbi:MAG TPA: protein kinase [Verrucomicrobiae bacterium]|jgi:serine/threonine protein kinase/tetratricopeptide (TPR) repeat protein